MKGLGGETPIPVIVLIQSVVCLVLILPVIFAQGRARVLQLMKTKNIKIHILRTLQTQGLSKPHKPMAASVRNDDIEFLICDIALLWRRLLNSQTKLIGISNIE